MALLALLVVAASCSDGGTEVESRSAVQEPSTAPTTAGEGSTTTSHDMAAMEPGDPSHHGGDPSHEAEGEDAHGDYHPACTDPVTPEQEAAGEQLIADVEASLARYVDLGAAEAAGFEMIAPPFGGVGAHYVNPANFRDGRILDPQHPESLVYDGGTLQGAMFILDEPEDEGPLPLGCLATWHSHDNLCMTGPMQEAGDVVSLTDFGPCPTGSKLEVPPGMLHVWVFDHPEGPFAPLET
jgi:hypothetical protein